MHEATNAADQNVATCNPSAQPPFGSNGILDPCDFDKFKNGSIPRKLLAWQTTPRTSIVSISISKTSTTPMYQVQSPCRVEDGKHIAQSKVAAFWHESWWRLSWTGRAKEYMVRGITDRSPKNLLTDRDVRRHQKAVHSETGDIVGYARWIMPESHKDSWLIAQTPDVSAEQKEIFTKRHAETEWDPRTDNDELDDHIDGWREKYKHADCMELHYIAVRPEHQKRGLASMLVRSGLAVADQLGVDVLVVATGRRGQGLYSKHGFEILDEKSQSMSKFGVDELYETFVMMRPAQK